MAGRKLNWDKLSVFWYQEFLTLNKETPSPSRKETRAGLRPASTWCPSLAPLSFRSQELLGYLLSKRLLTRQVRMFTKTPALGMKMPVTAYPAPPCFAVVKGSPLRVSEQQSCQNPINPPILWSPTFPSLNHHCLEHRAALATVVHTILKLWVGGRGSK